MKIKHRYKLVTNRPYKQKKGKVFFKLNSLEDIPSLLNSTFGSNWVRYEVDRSKDVLLPLGSGVYIIVLTDLTKGISDIAYIGSSNNLLRRFISHDTLHFLRHALSINFKIEIYIKEVKNGYHKSLEKDAIYKLKPFLNKEPYQQIFIEYNIR